MSLSVTVAPAVEPLTLADAKLHLRVETAATAEDALITALIVAARNKAEAETGRALITQTLVLTLDGFPRWSQIIRLPRPLAQSITSIQYVDTAGDTQTWAADQYDTDLPSGEQGLFARITPAFGVSYPTTRRQMNTVTITWVAGYGLAVTVPEAIKAAMRLAIGHWFEHREEVVVGTSSSQLQDTVDALLGLYTVERADLRYG